MPIIGVFQERIVAKTIRPGRRKGCVALVPAPSRPLLQDPTELILWAPEVDARYRYAVEDALIRLRVWRIGDMAVRPELVRMYSLHPDDPRLQCR